MRMLSNPLRLLIAGTLLGSAAIAPAAAFAQDDDDRYVAYVYEGTCADLAADGMLLALGELERSDRDDDDNDDWRFLSAGADRPDPLFLEDEDLEELSLEEVTATPHAIVVHEDEETTSPILVCGEIAGTPGPDGGFVIQLDEVEASGIEGRAWIGYEQDDDDDDTDDDLDMIVGLFTAGAVAPLATPAATPGI